VPPTQAPCLVTIRLLEARTDIVLVITDVGIPGTMNGSILAYLIRNRWPTVKPIVASEGTIVKQMRRMPSPIETHPKP